MSQRAKVPMLAPVPEDSSSARRESITNRNRRGDKTDPCLMPLFSWNFAEWDDPTRTRALALS